MKVSAGSAAEKRVPGSATSKPKPAPEAKQPAAPSAAAVQDAAPKRVAARPASVKAAAAKAAPVKAAPIKAAPAKAEAEAAAPKAGPATDAKQPAKATAAKSAEAKPAAKASTAKPPAVKAADAKALDAPAADATAGPAHHPGFSAQPQAAAPEPPPPMRQPPAPPIGARVSPSGAAPMAGGMPMGVAANDRRPPDRMPPPRAHAKVENFQEGDHVVYPTHGVGKVERIAVEEIAGHKLELIHITFEENRMTLRVPVTKAPAAGLRKLATRKMFDEALAVLKGRARIKRTMWSRRAQEYEAKINSGDPLAIAEVVRDLHRNAGQPDQSFSERQIYEAAMDRLAAELAALDKTDKATAAEKLANFLKTIP